MIDKINTNQVQDFYDKPSANQPGRAKSAKNHQPDATLQIDHASLMEQARTTQPADEQAIQRAMELLASGELDNPARIREAAENILNFGV